MSQKVLISGICLAALFLVIMPTDLLAGTTSKDFGAADIEVHTNSLQSFLFGTLIKMVAVFTGALGIGKSLMSSSVQPIVTFGTIALITLIMPKFIYAVFSATLT